MFLKIGALEKFAEFTGIQLCWSILLIKLQTFNSATLLEKDSKPGASLLTL